MVSVEVQGESLPPLHQAQHVPAVLVDVHGHLEPPTAEENLD